MDMMSGLNLNSLTENASRLGARIQESLSERTKDLSIARGATSSYFDAPEEKVKNIRNQLDSNSDREKLDGIKRLIALISKGRDVSEFFPQVVKNVSSQNIEIRKLVYIYLLRYAKSEPDLALLSINSFQKDLTDSNPLIRAMALRVLSGINVPVVGTVVVLAIKKCAGDISPYVRKAAALALVKCYNMDSAHLASLIPILTTLLRDHSPLSIGSVALAFQAICPTRLDLVHQNYRRLCRMLIDADEWGQVHLLDLLARYARSMLSKPIVGNEPGASSDVDPDLELLLKSAEPLFMSRNPAVVIAVARVFHYLAPTTQRRKYVDPLLRLLSRSKEVERLMLANLVVMTHDSPALFSPYYTRFYVRSHDMTSTKRGKLKILLNLTTKDNYAVILRELTDYAADPNELFVSESIQAIGQCARSLPESIQDCVSALMDLVNKNFSDTALSTSVIVLKYLIQTRLPSGAGIESPGISSSVPAIQIISKLAARIDEIKHSSARACVIWLVGQYAATSDSQGHDIPGIFYWAPDVLRRTAQRFSSEPPIVKLQIITLATKLQLLSSSHTALSSLSLYVFSLAQFDANYDVRDRARMLSSLLAGVAPHLRLSNSGLQDSEDDAVGGVVLRREQAILVLFKGKSAVLESNVWTDQHDVLGSMEVVLGRSIGLDSHRRLPDWPEEGTDSSLRDSEDDKAIPTTFTGFGQALAQPVAPASGTNVVNSTNLMPTGNPSPAGSITPQGPGSGKWMDLDKFYDTDEESEDHASDGEEESHDDGNHADSDSQATDDDENGERDEEDAEEFESEDTGP